MARALVGGGLRTGRNSANTCESVAVEGRVGSGCVLGRVCQAGTESKFRDAEGAVRMAEGGKAEAACIEGLLAGRNAACVGGAAGAQRRWQACRPSITMEL